jgi:hypothetical protein
VTVESKNKKERKKKKLFKESSSEAPVRGREGKKKNAVSTRLSIELQRKAGILVGKPENRFILLRNTTKKAAESP